MSKFGTQYFEGERELKMTTLSNFGLNPYALGILAMSYQHSTREPVKCTVEMNKLDPKMDKKEGEKSQVYIEMRTPGFLGKVSGRMKKPIDQVALKLVAQSYYANIRPLPVSFVFDGVEFHFRTPGVAEDKHKNIARDVFNPFQKITPKSQGR